MDAPLKQRLLITAGVSLGVFLFAQLSLSWLGLIAFVYYLLYTGRNAASVLRHVFGFALDNRFLRVIGGFVSFTTVSLFASLFILLHRLNKPVLLFVLIVNAITWLWVERRVIVSLSEPLHTELPPQQPGWMRWLIAAYLALIGLGWYVLTLRQAEAAITSPWQVVNGSYIYIFLAATLLLVGLIIIGLRPRIALWLLILHAFLLHSYLPLTHTLLYGADQWRHMGTEARIVAEQPLQVTVFGEQSLINRLNPGLVSYSQLWSATSLIARLGSLDLLTINKWLLPVVWSLVVPLLLYELALALGWKKRRSLLLVWLGSLPFAWHVAGSFTLPVNLGFIWWLLLMVALIRHFKNPTHTSAAVMAIGGSMLVFNYLLFPLLFWLTWGIVWFLKRYESQGWRAAAFAVAGSIAALPLVELVFGYSSLKLSGIGDGIQQFIGNFSAWYLGSGPRPHDIPGGNIIFNQTPSYAFVPNVFTYWRWWFVAVSAVILVIVIRELFRSLRHRSIIPAWLAVVACGVWGGYALSMYAMSGEHILARRLDVVLALVFVLFLFAGLQTWLQSFYRGVAVLAIASLAIAASYSLGPDTKTVSMDEYRAIEYVWSREQALQHRYCVLADTYPLLALEAVSAKQIIGGGFPINQHFAQPERVALYEQLKDNPNVSSWTKVFKLIDTDHCWLVSERSSAGYADADTSLFFGNVVAARYNRSTFR